MALYEKNKAGQLVPTSGEVPEEAITAIERADEQSIVQSLTKIEAQPFFAYSYPIRTKDGVKDIIGISTEGAKEIARQLGNIKATTDIRVEEKDDYFYVIIPMTDLVRNVTLLGVGLQSKYIIGEGMVPSDRIDESAFVKAISKAQRNGVLAIAPQETIAQIISRLDTRAIKRLSAPPPPKTAPGKATPAAADGKPEDSEIKSLRQQLHLKWDELAKLDETTGDKKDWLKETYGVESSIELSLEQIREALSKVNEMIGETGGPLATTEEKRELVNKLRDMGKSNDEIKTIFDEAKEGRGKTTKSDLEKIRAKIKEAPEPAEGEALDFLAELGE